MEATDGSFLGFLTIVMMLGLTMITTNTITKNFPSTCGNSSTVKYGATFSGKQLGNITLDTIQSSVSLICCSVSQSFARQRSSNITDGLPWSSLVLGPSKTHTGQVSVLCISFDYGAHTTAGNQSYTAGYTPRVPPPFRRRPPRAPPSRRGTAVPTDAFGRTEHARRRPRSSAAATRRVGAATTRSASTW